MDILFLTSSDVKYPMVQLSGNEVSSPTPPYDSIVVSYAAYFLTDTPSVGLCTVAEVVYPYPEPNTASDPATVGLVSVAIPPPLEISSCCCFYMKT